MFAALTMENETLAGGFLIALPIAFNVSFSLLASRFDYPDVLRLPTAEVLERFRAGGTGLVRTWWAFALTAVLLAPAAVLVAGALRGADPALLAVGATIGVLAAAVQFLGLVRWPFVVPHLAREAAAAPAGSARGEAVDVVFQSLNRYLGVAVGEHLGYGLTGAWSVLVGAACIQSAAVPTWVGVPGIAVGAALLVCSLEFVGRHEPDGWRVAALLTPPAYVLWSLWLVVVGVALVA